MQRDDELVRRVDEWDCIIIGGGIVGCSTAYFLARIGMRCLIIEADGIASAQSGRNLGFVRQQGRDLRELSLAMEANAIWRTLEAELGRSVGWRQGGIAAVADTAETEAAFEAWTESAKGFGLETRLLSGSEIGEFVPGLGGTKTRGIYTASDGVAEPVLATRAFFDSARAHGADASVGRPVDEIVTAGGAVAGVRIAGSFLKAHTVVCAAGAGTSRLLRKVGLLFPQDTARFTVIRTERTPFKIGHGVLTFDLAVRQASDGSIHISNMCGEYDVRPDSLRYANWFLPLLRQRRGAISLNFGNLLGSAGDAGQAQVTDMPPARDDPKPSQRYVRKAMKSFSGLFPAAANLGILSQWAGRVDYSPDFVCAVGSTKRVRGLLIASGFSGHGFSVGPAAGKALAAMASGQSAPASLAELSPDRFADGTWKAPPHTP